MHKLFFGAAHPAASSDTRHNCATATVRLIDPPRRRPETIIEQRLAAMLKSIGPLSVSKLVDGVAAALYDEELRTGAGVLDIGLFGSQLFHNDVTRELWAAEGSLWHISQDEIAR